MSLELNALFRKYAQQMADYDFEENTAQSAYANNVKDMGEARHRDLKQLANSMASSGMTHSGANLEANVNVQKGYDEGKVRADQERNRLISDLARRRLAAQQDFEAAKAADSLNLLAGAV